MSYKIKQGDCLELMPKVANESIDMILCDLPYGVTRNAWDSIIPLDKLWGEYKRIIKPNGAICLFCDGMFMAKLMMSNTPMWRYNLVWDKVLISGFLNANRMPLRQTEEIAVFYKKLPTYNPQFTQGNPLHSKGSAYKTKPFKNSNYGDFEITDDSRAGSTEKYPTNLVRFQKTHPSATIHPTEKPVALCEWLIKTYTNEGEIVLDNCMGSGSTGVAALNTNRNFIGFELDEGYFNIAKERIEACDHQGT